MDIEIVAPDLFENRIVEWLIPTGEVGYVQDTYGVDSLASWVEANLDSTARGEQGLAIFTSPSVALNTARWREELLLKARQWLTAARQLAGKTSVLGRPGFDLHVIDEAATLAYIEQLAGLHRFAEVVFATATPVEVRPTHPSKAPTFIVRMETSSSAPESS